jgi:hypothetical protein
MSQVGFVNTSIIFYLMGIFGDPIVFLYEFKNICLPEKESISLTKVKGIHGTERGDRFRTGPLQKGLRTISAPESSQRTHCK